MTTQPHDHHGGERIPRPDRTPPALRAALAAVAPSRLAEMEQHKDEAFAAMAQDSKISHVHTWLAFWAREVEVERRPDLAQRRNHALRSLHTTTSKDDPAFRTAMEELRAVEAEADQAVSG
ncbi:hypothetical protein [Streptomyces sp. RKAG293]|uniref:hypothetical protein n=1 Tax=Streptomyces sp. RKAG293 TaxID=2893403 RepID=UPI00203458FA|nr:hypothetical protein [Streptomyces sp. RKAG293]MCM2424217.1 hypothetical protein [Streptomyces sp. RKAG293]